MDIKSLKPLLPILLKIEPKIRFYTPKKKDDILAGIAEIKSELEKIMSNRIE